MEAPPSTRTACGCPHVPKPHAATRRRSLRGRRSTPSCRAVAWARSRRRCCSSAWSAWPGRCVLARMVGGKVAGGGQTSWVVGLGRGGGREGVAQNWHGIVRRGDTFRCMLRLTKYGLEAKEGNSWRQKLNWLISCMPPSPFSSLWRRLCECRCGWLGPHPIGLR